MSRLFSTTAKRVMSNTQHSGRFTDTLSSNINKLADNVGKFANKSGKIAESTRKQCKQIYEKWDSEEAMYCGTIFGGTIGTMVGIYTIEKYDEFGAIFCKSGIGMISGGMAGCLCGFGLPLLVPVVPIMTLGYAKRAIS